MRATQIISTKNLTSSQFKKMQMVDVHLPTTDGRHLKLSRYTQPDKEHNILNLLAINGKRVLYLNVLRGESEYPF